MTHPSSSAPDCRGRTPPWILVAFLLLLPAALAPTTASAQTQELGAASMGGDGMDRDALELEKLRLEVDKLRAEKKGQAGESAWAVVLRAVGVFIPVGAVAVGAWATFIFNRRLTELKVIQDKSVSDQKETADREANARREAAEHFSDLVESRAQTYSQAFGILAPTAIYFPAPGGALSPGEGATGAAPSRGELEPQLDKDDCIAMGRALAAWYFGQGGLLMSEGSRDAYFALVEALRLASLVEDKLAVPTVGDHARLISLRLIARYRGRLAREHVIFRRLKQKKPVEAAHIRTWKFGATNEAANDAARCQDFILIQQLGSRLRTALTEDIGSRRPPMDAAAPTRKGRKVASERL